jgi:hypothetical protein
MARHATLRALQSCTCLGQPFRHQSIATVHKASVTMKRVRIIRARTPRRRTSMLAAAQTVARSRSEARLNGLSRLRCAYFSQAGESAGRYGVTFERMLVHLWRARQTNRHLVLRSISHVDDLVHAVACVDGTALAWIDLAERYERALVRRCDASQEVDAMILVRRLFAELLRRNCCTPSPSAPSLRCYAGDRPLKIWLAERLAAMRFHAALETGRLRIGWGALTGRRRGFASLASVE